MSRRDAILEPVGNWSNQIEIPLHNAMQAGIELWGNSGRKACERAMVYMARAAGSASQNLTKQAKKNLKVQRDEGGQFVQPWNAGKRYKWMFSEENMRKPATSRPTLLPSWEVAKRVPNRGLARRSWMWGIKGLAKSTSKPIPGVGVLTEELKPNLCALVLTNRLDYIDRATVPNIQEIVARSASNQIMAQVAKRAEREFGIVVHRLEAQRQKKAARKLEREFQRAKGSGRE